MVTVTCCRPATRLAGVTMVPCASITKPEPDAAPASTRTTDGPTCAIKRRTSAWIAVSPPGGAGGAGAVMTCGGGGALAAATSSGVANRTGDAHAVITTAAAPAAMASHLKVTNGSLEPVSK